MEELTSVPEDTDPPERSAVARTIERYCETLRGLQTTFTITFPLIAEISIRQDKAFDKFVEENNIEREEEADGVVYSFPIELGDRFMRIRKRKNQLDVAYFHLPRALLVSLVSAYDSYLADLLRGLFALKPEMIESSGRQFTFKELSTFGTIDAARTYLIDKEVEGLIRESHITQFDWLESRFSMVLRKELPSWETFVEVTERRNLYVHTDGVVSEQYLTNCKKHGVDTAGLKPGDRLPDFTPDYFASAWKCLFEIGAKLGHVLWRKISNDLKSSDDELIEMVYDLLKDEDYDLAAELGHFSTSVLRKHSSALCRKTLLVNYCIALRFGGDPKRCREVLDAEDWSDSDDAFQIAHAVLTEDFQKASNIMKEAGKENKRLTRRNYEMWPLFKGFRESEEFKSAYRDVFGEDYEVPEKASKASPKSKKQAAAQASKDDDHALPSPAFNDAEQDGADQPATAPESKPESDSSPEPESEPRPQ